MVIIIMGVTGCGKTTIGQLLAAELGLPFHDADAFHPPANRAKLQAGQPLDDADRWPWLEALNSAIRQWQAAAGAVLACSALKQSYRDVLQRAAGPVQFVYLRSESGIVTNRISNRQHELIKDFDAILAGQYRDLEEPADAIVVDNQMPPKTIVWQIRQALKVRGCEA